MHYAHRSPSFQFYIYLIWNCEIKKIYLFQFYCLCIAGLNYSLDRKNKQNRVLFSKLSFTLTELNIQCVCVLCSVQCFNLGKSVVNQAECVAVIRFESHNLKIPQCCRSTLISKMSKVETDVFCPLKFKKFTVQFGIFTFFSNIL